MAIERHVVTIIQIVRMKDGIQHITGDEPYYILGAGDYDETRAALNAAKFQPYDRLGDIVDAQLRDEQG